MLMRKENGISLNSNRMFSLGAAAILTVYFALKPVYLAESGFLQVSDVFLILALGCLLLQARGIIHFNQENSSVLKTFFFTIVYQAIINVIWSLVTGDANMNRHVLYYVFNFLAFAGCLYIGQKVGCETVKRAIGFGSFLAVIVTAAGLIFFSGSGIRSTGFFNNPNQLGYFAVIMLTVIALCKDQMNKIEIAFVFVISFWSMIASLSKAAILAYFIEVIVLILFYQNNRTTKRLVIEFALLAVVGAAIYFLFYSNNSIIIRSSVLSSMRRRILLMSEENDSGFSYGRGYARIAEILPHLLWGTGEGAYERFSTMHGTEVHSTFASLISCYGIIGLTGYLVVFIKCMGKKKQFIQNAVLLSGLFLYALSHNGIRNTLLWIVIALLYLCTSQAGTESAYTWDNNSRTTDRGSLLT